MIRIGMVNYINTAPIYEIWKRKEETKKYKIIEEPPSILNRMLSTGGIDLGFVSSFEYGARPERYRILQNLSISATGSVGSVFLFSNYGLKDLDDKLILLSNQSETSVCLVKIILEEFHAVKPQYILGEVLGEMRASCQGVMAIGDDALRLAGSNQYKYKYDLGEIWHQFTGMPFVFSVCVVRDEFCRNNFDLVEDIQNLLISCRIEGETRLDEICKIVAPRIPMEFNKCHNYLRALEYDLDGLKKEALAKFFQLLIKRGEAHREALPLRLFP